MSGLPRLAVDFGTSHTVAICQWRHDAGQPLLFDASPLLPSAVLAQTRGSLLVGRDAQRGARSDPASVEPYPKRRIDEGRLLLGYSEFAVVDVIAAVLRRCADEAARVAGSPVAEAVLTHPAAWGPQRRTVLTEAAQRAGIGVPILVAEPTAAAIYFTQVLGVRIAPGAAVLVYDLGAGTFDVAVVRRQGEREWTVLDCNGLDDLGGVELDATIVDGLRHRLPRSDPEMWRRLNQPQTAADTRARTALWDDARAAKEQLSRSSTAGLHVPIYDLDVHVTREEFEQAAGPLIERTVTLTASTLAASGLAPSQLAGLFLVGGSSRIPLVATMLHRHLGIAPTVIEQPELVVAQGALRAVSAPPASEPARAAVTPPALPDGSADSFPALPPDALGPVEPPARRPRRPVRIVTLAAGVVLVLTAALLVVLFNRGQEPELTEAGRRNEAVFKSEALTKLARPWLNDVSECRQRPADTYGGRATEYVACITPQWEVQFRAMASTADRGKSRTNRNTGYGGNQQPFTGQQPKSGQRIDYLYGVSRVIYWDDDKSAVVGDLTTDVLTAGALAGIWRAHVT